MLLLPSWKTPFQPRSSRLSTPASSEFINHSSLLPLRCRAPVRPFKRLDYKDAITWLNENGIKTDEGKDHVVGDDIAEAAERRMVVSFPVLSRFYIADILRIP
jgi:asparaginyl-tRNA synthetase